MESTDVLTDSYILSETTDDDTYQEPGFSDAVS